MSDAMDATENLISLTSRMLEVARLRTGETKLLTPLGKTVEESLKMIETHSRLDECRLEVQVGSAVEVDVYPELVTHAVINLVLNAAEAAGPGCLIRVSLQVESATVSLLVEDDGPGIPEELRDEILAPFFTTKKTGTGLGLFSVAYCAVEHGGEFQIEDSELGGAKMTLRFPVDAETVGETGVRDTRPVVLARSV